MSVPQPMDLLASPRHATRPSTNTQHAQVLGTAFQQCSSGHTRAQPDCLWIGQSRCARGLQLAGVVMGRGQGNNNAKPAAGKQTHDGRGADRRRSRQSRRSSGSGHDDDSDPYDSAYDSDAVSGRDDFPEDDDEYSQGSRSERGSSQTGSSAGRGSGRGLPPPPGAAGMGGDDADDRSSGGRADRARPRQRGAISAAERFGRSPRGPQSALPPLHRRGAPSPRAASGRRSPRGIPRPPPPPPASKLSRIGRGDGDRAAYSSDGGGSSPGDDDDDDDFEYITDDDAVGAEVERKIPVHSTRDTVAAAAPGTSSGSGSGSSSSPHAVVELAEPAPPRAVFRQASEPVSEPVESPRSVEAYEPVIEMEMEPPPRRQPPDMLHHQRISDAPAPAPAQMPRSVSPRVPRMPPRSSDITIPAAVPVGRARQAVPPRPAVPKMVVTSPTDLDDSSDELMFDELPKQRAQQPDLPDPAPGTQRIVMAAVQELSDGDLSSAASSHPSPHTGPVDVDRRFAEPSGADAAGVVAAAAGATSAPPRPAVLPVTESQRREQASAEAAAARRVLDERLARAQRMREERRAAAAAAAAPMYPPPHRPRPVDSVHVALKRAEGSEAETEVERVAGSVMDPTDPTQFAAVPASDHLSISSAGMRDDEAASVISMSREARDALPSLLLDDDALCDVDFVFPNCSKQTVLSAHRAVLASRSRVLRQHFTSKSLDPSLHTQVVIQDVSPVHFATLLRYCYTMEVRVRNDNALALLRLAHRYELPRLLRIVDAFLVQRLSASNACAMLVRTLGFSRFVRDGTRHRSGIEIVRKSSNVILDKFPEASKPEALCKFGARTLFSLLGHARLALRDDQLHFLVIALIRWLDHDRERRVPLVDKAVLPMLRLAVRHNIELQRLIHQALPHTDLSFYTLDQGVPPLDRRCTSSVTPDERSAYQAAPRLIARLDTVLAQGISKANCWRVLLDTQRLRDLGLSTPGAAWHRCVTSFRDVYTHADFLALDSDMLTMLVRDDDLCVSDECTVLEALLLWADADPATRLPELAVLIASVRWAHMTVETLKALATEGIVSTSGAKLPAVFYENHGGNEYFQQLNHYLLSAYHFKLAGTSYPGTEGQSLPRRSYRP